VQNDVCVYVRMCVCVHVYIYLYRYPCTYIYIYKYIYIYIHIYIYVYINSNRLHVQNDVCVYVRMCLCACVHLTTCVCRCACVCVHECKWCIQPSESHTKKLLMRNNSSTHETTAWMTSGRFSVGFRKAAEMACGNSKPVKSWNCVVNAEERSLLSVCCSVLQCVAACCCEELKLCRHC